MIRLTIDVSASSFTANIAIKQSDLDYAKDYPQEAHVVDKLIGVDDHSLELLLLTRLSSFRVNFKKFWLWRVRASEVEIKQPSSIEACSSQTFGSAVTAGHYQLMLMLLQRC